ncbi:helix-turn-helix domain-containing protein [Thomasclavelia cocleata]|uniref:helix-turn-helix domain-containing protein n=1 Tax=Thomasclavelia cocleata TaxID=69824 RepID=UPI002616ED75|nr:helix-turn-helix transcriptional regulator [Thomasclavelia cocleata]
MTIGEKITKLRKEQNLTQEQLADILKVSRQSVSKWERNVAYPDTEKLIRINKIFECSLDYLLKDELEQMDVNLTAAKEDAGYDKIRAAMLTYLSFPPIFGWIIGIVSLIFQKNHMKNKIQISLTIIGMLFSLTCTILMIAGALLGL